MVDAGSQILLELLELNAAIPIQVDVIE